MFTRLVALCILVSACFVADARTQTTKPVHIELRYDVETQGTGLAAKKLPIVPYSYFFHTDIYSNDEEKIGSQSVRDGVTALDFELERPLYDMIVMSSSVGVPFYVEPGDSLFIKVTRHGKVLGYSSPGGREVKCLQLMKHDFTNNELYTARDFEEDRRGVRFPEFVRRVERRMQTVLDSVEHVAERWQFSDRERRIALNNVKMQFGLWLFEFMPYKSMQLNTYSSTHKGGWQSTADEDRTYADIMNVENYRFFRSLPLHDSTCMASRYFPQFMMSYEHTQFLNSDQYLYYGTSLAEQARMDSAFIARDRQLTGHLRQSLFMDIAIERRHYVPPVDDGSVKLQEVQVIGAWQQNYPSLTPQDMLNARLNSKPTFNVLSPSYWLYDRKREKTRRRVRALLKKMDEADEEERKIREEEDRMKVEIEEMRKGK